MSTQKKVILQSSSSSKLNSKGGTPNYSTLRSSTPKTGPKAKVVRNLSGNSSSSSVSLNSTTLPDPHHSQKYIQHKLDMVFNKYLQTLALNTWLTKMHKEAEASIDEQLVHDEELYETCLEREQMQKDLLNDMKTVYATECKIKALEISLEKIISLLEGKDIIKKIKKLNANLHYICDKLTFENIKFVSSEENYSELQRILEEISIVISEINNGDSEEFLVLVDNIFKIKEMLKKLRKNQEVVKNYQHDLNNITLQAASLELSKTNDATIEK